MQRHTWAAIAAATMIGLAGCAPAASEAATTVTVTATPTASPSAGATASVKPAASKSAPESSAVPTEPPAPVGYTAEFAGAVSEKTVGVVKAASEGEVGEMWISTTLQNITTGARDDAKATMELCDTAMELWHFDLVKIMSGDGTVVGGFGLPGSQDAVCAHFYPGSYSGNGKVHDDGLGEVAVANLADMAGAPAGTFTYATFPYVGVLEIGMSSHVVSSDGTLSYGTPEAGTAAAVDYCYRLMETGAYSAVSIVEISGEFTVTYDPHQGGCAGDPTEVDPYTG